MYVFLCRSMCKEARGQLLGVRSFFFFYHVSLELRSTGFGQVPLPTKPSNWSHEKKSPEMCTEHFLPVLGTLGNLVAPLCKLCYDEIIIIIFKSTNVHCNESCYLSKLCFNFFFFLIFFW